MSRARSVSSPELARCAAAFQAEVDYVYRTLRRYGVSPADAEDLAQDVFAVMWRRWSDYQPDRPLRPWLAGIAFHLARDHIRKKSQRELATEAVDLPDDGPLPDEQLALARVRGLALTALGRLPAAHREVFIRHELDGRSVREIARDAKIPLFTVYSRLRRARLRFNKELQALQTRGVVLTSAALLDVERVLPPAPEGLRRRLAGESARLRVVERAAPKPVAPRTRAPILPAAVATFGAAMLALLWLARPTPSGAVPAAVAERPVASDAAARSTTTRLPTPRPVPKLIRLDAEPAPPQPADDPALARGLVAHWRFEDGRGSAIARDASGNGRDCLLRDLDVHQAWVEGAVGGGIDLGTRGWLECRLPEARSGVPFELSIAIWIKPARRRTTPSFIVARQLAGRANHFVFDMQAEHLRVASNSWVGWTTRAFPPGQPPNDVYTHVAFSHTAQTTRLFINGELVGKRAGHRPRGEGAVRGTLTVGAGRYTADPDRVRGHFHGALDELLVYDRALEDAEIFALYAAGAPRDPRNLAQR